MTSYQFELPGGRMVGVSLLGEPTATRLVVLCLPTPGAGGFDPDPLVTDRHPVRLVCVDRPGYGGSDPLGDDVAPTVERFADDVADYLRHTMATATGLSGLTIGPAAVIGWSFGGVVAMALAARHPDLVDRLVVVSSARPSRLKRGERFSPVMELRKRGVERTRASLTATLDEEGRPNLGALGIVLDEAAALGLGTTSRLEHMIDESWAQGAAGVASDRSAIANDAWARGLGDISANSLLVYSDIDPVASLRDAKWYARRLPAGTVTETSPGGRLAIIQDWGRILGWVTSPATG